MLRNMMGWGGVGGKLMLTFLELAYMVDATQLSRQLVQQVYQWVWRKHIGVKTSEEFLKELQRILKI